MADSCNNISAVIRTLNEEERIGVLLDTLRAQKNAGADLEIVVVDSGSTDKTLAIVRQHKVKLIQIHPEEFNYSKALNLGIAESLGDFIFVLSGHTVPASRDWVSQMTQHFADPAVAGVYCRQKAWDDAGRHERRRILATFGNVSRTITSSTEDEIAFSNAASCVRRSVWEKHRFKVLPAAEDREWAEWALAHQYKIVYDAEAAVYHSHNESARKAAKRLIEIERNTDIQRRRKRTRALTICQALKCFVELAKSDITMDACISEKVRAIIQDTKYVLWFILDFKN